VYGVPPAYSEVTEYVRADYAAPDLAPAGELVSREVVDEVEHRLDAVVDAAVAWATEDADDEEFDRCEVLSEKVDALLQLRSIDDLPRYAALPPVARVPVVAQAIEAAATEIARKYGRFTPCSKDYYESRLAAMQSDIAVIIGSNCGSVTPTVEEKHETS
jgi:hypothetical protein